ncbi:MAG: Xaa-Pro peptidase family protein [candidate division Zixibacteria bacterium]|nr:Xaa-Pro peptidase family protein [candidate division Zixibacteria bacterium]
MKNRIKKLVSLLEKENLDALLVSFRSNVRYLSGYDGTNGLVLLTGDKGFFLTDFRYQEQAKKEVRDLKLHFAQRELIYDLTEFKFLQKKNQRIGFEANYISYSTVQKLKEILPNALLVPTENLVESLLIIKDKSEITKIEKAAQITDKTFSHILDLVKPGVREKDLAAEIEHSFKRMGGDGPAFSTIVASGYRSSMPHGRASNKKLKMGEFITFDMGAMYQGYVSDMTRTLVLGKATPKQKKIYSLVLKAQTKAISRAKAGISGMELDKVAREVIAKAGYGKYFGHGLGHGLGLEVHSGPVVNARSKTILKPGMVITIEPGIYIPGWGGVRIEDDVLITARGCKVLNQSPKNLIEIR